MSGAFKAAVLSLVTLSACATPGFKYTSSVAPGNPEAASLRTVAVDQFHGPFADWYGDQFKRMLTYAEFEDAPWFRVGLFAEQSDVEGVYVGEIEIGYPDVHETYHSSSSCVKRDKENDKCLKKKKVEKVCLRYTIEVAVTPQLLDARTGEVVHQATYVSSGSDRECFKTGRVVYKVRREPNEKGRGKYRVAHEDYGRPGYRPGSDDIIDRIAAEALRSTLWKVRRDIAPYNRDVRAKILTKAETPAAGADARFETAVKAVRARDLAQACDAFEQLQQDYPGEPAVLHNLGACAEATGFSERAQVFYADAANRARALGEAPKRRILEALDRITEQRGDELVLDALQPAEPRY